MARYQSLRRVAYIVSRGDHGLQIVHAQFDGVITDEVTPFRIRYYGFGNAHIMINEETGYAYPIGTTPSMKLHVLNLVDPLNPVLVGADGAYSRYSPHFTAVRTGIMRAMKLWCVSMGTTALQLR